MIEGTVGVLTRRPDRVMTRRVRALPPWASNPDRQMCQRPAHLLHQGGVSLVRTALYLHPQQRMAAHAHYPSATPRSQPQVPVA